MHQVLQTQTRTRLASDAVLWLLAKALGNCAQDFPARLAPAASYLRRSAQSLPAARKRGLSGSGAARQTNAAGEASSSLPPGTRSKHPLQIRPHRTALRARVVWTNREKKPAKRLQSE
ncbi:hypothetical protein NN561_009388 [Cricetulus griseus]